MPVTLDMMEYANDGLAQAAYVSSDAGDPGSWDLLDEDCADIGDWVDDDAAPAVSEVSPAGQFRFDTNSPGGNRARRKRDIGTFPNVFTVEIKLYHDAIGTVGDEHCFFIFLRKATKEANIAFASDGLFIADDAGYHEIGTDLVKHGGSAAWQIWRFIVNLTSDTIDIFLDGDLIEANVNYIHSGTFTEGFVYLWQHGGDDMVTHVDYVKIATGAYPRLQCYSEDTIFQQGTRSLKVITKATDSLNDTLTRTIGAPIDLSGQDVIYLAARSSRTGSNIKIRIRDAGTVWSEYTIAISVANVWEIKTWDISGIADGDKDAIDRIQFLIFNADADNLFYCDDIYAEIAVANAPFFGCNF